MKSFGVLETNSNKPGHSGALYLNYKLFGFGVSMSFKNYIYVSNYTVLPLGLNVNTV